MCSLISKTMSFLKHRLAKKSKKIIKNTRLREKKLKKQVKNQKIHNVRGWKDIGVNLFNGFKKLKPLNKIGVNFSPT